VGEYCFAVSVFFSSPFFLFFLFFGFRPGEFFSTDELFFRRSDSLGRNANVRLRIVVVEGKGEEEEEPGRRKNEEEEEQVFGVREGEDMVTTMTTTTTTTVFTRKEEWVSETTTTTTTRRGGGEIIDTQLETWGPLWSGKGIIIIVIIIIIVVVIIIISLCVCEKKHSGAAHSDEKNRQNAQLVRKFPLLFFFFLPQAFLERREKR
jgi:hypothetical protein